MVAALVPPLPALAQDVGDAGPLAGFTLVDASDQSVLATLSDGASVELADPDGGSYGIRADLAGGETVGSVSLALSGAKTVSRTENLVPYSLYGDHRDGGARRLNGEALPAGAYTLTAAAYAGRSLGGDRLGAMEVSFTITKADSAPEVVEDPDGTREGAVSLGEQSPDRGRQFFYDKSLDRAAGDGVDYYTFSTAGRYTLGLGVRDQTIDLDSWLEDSDGNTVAQSGPPIDPSKDQTIEWLKATIDAGTYYIKVEAAEDGATGYYLRFGLAAAPAPVEPRQPEFPPAPPGAPHALLAAASHDSVQLLWQAPDDDTVTGYQVLRREVDADLPQEMAVLVEDTGSTDTQYTDNSVSAETAYEYQVKAINGSGAGEGSDTHQVTTPSDPDQEDDRPILPQSRQTELWSATLTVARSGQLGCFDNGHRLSSSDCRNSNVLSDNTFTYDGTTYTIRSLYTAAVTGFYTDDNGDRVDVLDRRIFLYLDKDLADNTIQLVLHVGNEALPFWSARIPQRIDTTKTVTTLVPDRRGREFLDTGINWTEGQQVNLRIVHDHDAGPTLNPVRNFRAHGGSGTVTLRWSIPADLGKMIRDCSRGDLRYEISRAHIVHTVDSINTIRFTENSVPIGTWNYTIEPVCEIDNQPFSTDLTEIVTLQVTVS